MTGTEIPYSKEKGRVNVCKAVEDMKTNAKNEGRNEGILDTLVGLVKDGFISLAEAAKRVNMTVSEFEDKTGLKA